MTCATVTVLMASYNGHRYLDEQVASILNQRGVAIRLLARDDGSLDGTGERLAEFCARDAARVAAVADQLGPTGSAAKNFFALLRSVDLDACDYVAFSDQDDVWLPEKLDRAVIQLQTAGGGGYSSDLLSWNPATGQKIPLRKGGRKVPFDYLFQGASAGCTYVLDSNAARIVRGRLASIGWEYCPGVSHDWTIYAICRSAGLPWTHDEHANILYRQHDNNVYGARQGLAGISARAEMMRSGWYRDHVLWLAQVICNRPEESAILAAVKSLGWMDRLRLAIRCSEFRRQTSEVWMLRLAFLTGLLR